MGFSTSALQPKGEHREAMCEPEALGHREPEGAG